MNTWISIEDQQPSEGVPVLVTDETGIHTAVGKWDFSVPGEIAYWIWEGQSLAGIPLNEPTNYELDDEYLFTHWMELPPTLHNNSSYPQLTKSK